MRACVDCKHSSNSSPPLCYHPANRYDFSTGETRVVPCDAARSGWSLISECGPGGRWFDAREPDPETPPACARFVDRLKAVVKALRGGVGADVVGRKS